ncbi:18955_t:CDS:2 [Entrophospora sp. SA101]|nr:18955_t:CDS:2 [Entrophospora sp. SA101]
MNIHHLFFLDYLVGNDIQQTLRESEENYKSNIEDFQEKFEQSTENVQKNLVKKQEESDELQKNSEQLGEELLRIRAELEARNEQIEELQKQISNNKSSSSPPPKQTVHMSANPLEHLLDLQSLNKLKHYPGYCFRMEIAKSA